MDSTDNLILVFPKYGSPAGGSFSRTQELVPVLPAGYQNLLPNILSNFANILPNFDECCSFGAAPLVPTQFFSVSMMPKAVSKSEFTENHESGLRSD